MSAAIISGTFAAVVAVVAGVLSYVFGKRTMERQLADNITQIGATGEQERITAQREYQLDAMKTFRGTVGGPKGQVIESAHDLSDRLRKLVGRDSAASGVSTDPWGLMRGQNGFYRRNTAWLILHPFIWIDVLRGKLVFLDQTLGELVEDEFRFLNSVGCWRGPSPSARCSRALTTSTERSPTSGTTSCVFSPSSSPPRERRELLPSATRSS